MNITICCNSKLADQWVRLDIIVLQWCHLILTGIKTSDSSNFESWMSQNPSIYICFFFNIFCLKYRMGSRRFWIFVFQFTWSGVCHVFQYFLIMIMNNKGDNHEIVSKANLIFYIIVGANPQTFQLRIKRSSMSQLK